jgi:hypothetical protein
VSRPARTARQDRRKAGRILGLATIVAITGLAPASALAATGPGPFGLTPVATAAGMPRPYFNLTVAPGQATKDIVVVTNGGTTTVQLKIGTGAGVTAQNSGSAYYGLSARCTGAACWVTGLPTTVTLPPRTGKALGFTVNVPAGTEPAQYLAGITAELAARPAAAPAGTKGSASAKVIVIDQVTVGVAVTVGARAQLKTALAVSPVTAGWIGSTPRLYIPVRNPGQTFVKATGTVSCQPSGQSAHSYRVIMETVLPGGGAVLPVNAPGLRSGTMTCTVRLDDGTAQPVVRSGLVTLAAAKQVKLVHTANGVYTALPSSGMPVWAIALMVLGGLILAALVVVVVRVSRARPQS